jgi:hypothetical protein
VADVRKQPHHRAVSFEFALVAFAALSVISVGMFATESRVALVLTSLSAAILGSSLVALVLRTSAPHVNQDHADDTPSSNGAAIASVTAIIDRRLQVAEQASKIGLAECVHDSSVYDYTPILLESKNVTILLNDGRTWTSVHRDRLRRRFAGNGSTTIYLIHPDSAVLPILARKGSIEPEVLRSRIQETLSLLADICGPTSRLEVLGHHLYNPHSLVLSEKRGLVTPYFASRGGRTVPIFAFEDVGQDCHYRQMVADMEALRMDSELLMAHGAEESAPSGVIPFRRHA